MSTASGSSDGGGQQEDDWDDWEGDESNAVRSLFSDASFPTVGKALAFDASQHGFDLNQYRVQACSTSQYDTIKLINYIRAEVASGTPPGQLVAALAATAASPVGRRPWDDDAYFRPVLPEDELLLHDWEADGAPEQLAAQPASPAGADAAAAAAAALGRENERLRAALAAMQELALQDDGIRSFLLSERTAAADGDGASATAAAGPSEAGRKEGAASAQAAAADRTYFESYSAFDIHREMLGDRVRTEAYRRALEGNPLLVKGATVLDVGCGTGVLSMFAARGGAARVVAVDASPEIAAVAANICAANGYAAGVGGPITVVSSRVEDLGELPGGGGKADVLVSEWMGYALLFESMLDSVLTARDRFLKPGGAVLPDVARLFVAAAGEGATGLGFWRDVYGLSMAPVADALRQAALREAVVRGVPPADLLTEAQRLASFDLATMAASEQDFTAEVVLEAAAGPRQCHALVLWFDALFTDRFCGEAPAELGTGPYGQPTHWAQTVLVLPEPVTLAPAAVAARHPGAATALRGRVSMARRAGRHRCLDISVEYAPVFAGGGVGPSRTQLYSMGVGGTD